MNKLILYTDGSFKPNVEGDQTLGCYGSGAHGYIFNTETGLKKTTDTPTNYSITSAGYMLVNEVNKEENIEVSPHAYIDASYSFLNKGTVSRAELLAIKCSLDSVLKNNEELKIEAIHIWADSTYAIGVVDMILKDPSVTEALQPTTPNLDIIKELQETINNVIVNIELTIDKVKAHSFYIGNNTADSLAYYARLQSGFHNVESNFNIYKISKGVRYWDFELEENELLKFKQLFFTNSLRAAHSEIIYSVMNYKTDVEPGTRTHDALMGLIILKNPPQIIEDAISTYHKGIYTTSVLSTVNLKNLYSREVAYHYHLYGSKIFSFTFRDKELLKQRIPIVSQIKSPGLGTKLIMDMQFMYGFINTYKNSKELFEKDNHIKVGKNLELLNITDKIYQVNAKKKNVCVLESGSTYLSMDHEVFGKTLKFPLSLGKDTLERNQFKRLESKKPIVCLVVEKMSNKSFRYYSIVEAEEDIGIYANLYSNLIVTE